MISTVQGRQAVRQTVSAGWFAGLALCLLLANATPVPAHDNLARIETASGGPYTILIGLVTEPHTGTPLEVTIIAAPGAPSLERTTVVLSGEPGLGTDAVPTRPISMTLEEGMKESFEAKIGLTVRGAWKLRFAIDGPKGPGVVVLPVTVSAPEAIPVWLGWGIAMAPLLGLLWFVGWNRRYLVRLRAEVG
jgi:hypothetical protein